MNDDDGLLVSNSDKKSTTPVHQNGARIPHNKPTKQSNKLLKGHSPSQHRPIAHAKEEGGQEHKGPEQGKDSTVKMLNHLTKCPQSTIKPRCK